MKIDLLFFVDDNITDSNLEFNGKYLPEHLASILSKIDTVSESYFSIPQSYSGNLKNNDKSFVRESHDDTEFWKEVFNKTKSDHMVKIFADSPFIDPAIISEMIEVHSDNLSEFTYSENLPQGLTCEIISRELITVIPDFEEKTLPLSQIIKSNINHFDVELYYKNPDLRDKRISFRLKNPRDRIIMENIFNINKVVPSYGEIRNIIESDPDVLYIGPSYIEIELTGRCDLDCLFCYRKALNKVHVDMDIDLFKNILSQLKQFNLPFSICFGGSGEPLMHDNFYEIMDITVADPLVENIIIETNGIYADNIYKEYLQEKGSRITTIININGNDPESYKELHGKDNFDNILKNIVSLHELNGDEKKVYIQVMKINETRQLPGKISDNKEYLDTFYDFWEEKGVPIILQKQNTYLGIIEDRRYSDLSPIERIPCWHLQRDLYIMSDGTIGYCRQDVDGKYSKYNISGSDLNTIWNSRRENFLNDYRKKYQTNPDCKNCDEWYTFNL